MKVNDILREKTNSITHLVKIVAQEVFNENNGNINEAFNNRLKKIEEELKELNCFIKMKSLDNIGVIEQECEENRGKSWSVYEDKLLNEEYKQLLKKIAANHKRTVGSIRARINQKELSGWE